VLKKIAWGTAGLLLVASMALELSVTRAYAAKVDCDKVMAEVNAGKKGTEVAKDLGISSSSVYRCKKKARAKAAAGSATPSSSPAAGASPASAASPGTAKPKKHKKPISAASPSPAAVGSPGM
jgi:hypothetical protein